MTQLLTTSNPKTAKNAKNNAYTAVLHLLPANLSGKNLCPMASAGCKSACLHTAGNPAYMQGKSRARAWRSDLYNNHRQLFLTMLWGEIAAHIAHCPDGMRAAIRLNGTSDINWLTRANQLYSQTVFDAFPAVQFYDYTKVAKIARQSRDVQNYHVTYSLDETNESEAIKLLREGHNVAVVFRRDLPIKYLGYPVIDGDMSDYRPHDPDGCVVGLRAKGAAKRDSSGFVIDP